MISALRFVIRGLRGEIQRHCLIVVLQLLSLVVKLEILVICLCVQNSYLPR